MFSLSFYLLNIALCRNSSCDRSKQRVLCRKHSNETSNQNNTTNIVVKSYFQMCVTMFVSIFRLENLVSKWQKNRGNKISIKSVDRRTKRYIHAICIDFCWRWLKQMTGKRSNLLQSISKSVVLLRLLRTQNVDFSIVGHMGSYNKKQQYMPKMMRIGNPLN